MKNKNGIILSSLKTNKEILEVFKKSKKINIPICTIWLGSSKNKKEINYALLVNKSQFKSAVVRNKIKRQLRSILIQLEMPGGFKILLKPNTTYLNKTFNEVKTSIINILTKNKNGK